MGSGREYTQIKRPLSPPMDLDAGKINVLQAGLSGLVSLCALLLASFGGWIVVRSWAVAYLGVAIGFALFLVGAAVGVSVLFVSLGEWRAHSRRLDEWHYETLAAWRENGAETVETDRTGRIRRAKETDRR